MKRQKTSATTSTSTKDIDDDDTKERFTFFFRAESPFSQFHPSPFIGSSLFPEPKEEDQKEEYKFNHCEQWMMFNKAKLFKDEESALKILKAANPPECKALGRKVKNFDPALWGQHNVNIIYEGNRLKFTQNPKLLEQLQATAGTTLVEASPFDGIYGIGMSANNPNALSRKTWRGRNLLGETLTKLREDLNKT